MPDIPAYEELRVRIEQDDSDHYWVRAEARDGSTARRRFRLPFDDTELAQFVLSVGTPRGRRRAGHSFGVAEVNEAQAFGRTLFDAVFSDDIREVYRSARQRADSKEKGLRITLSLSTSDLQNVPWEYLYEEPMFLSQSVETPVVRSLDLKSVREPRKLELPLRILGVVSEPSGEGPLNADEERETLEQALSPLVADGAVEMDWLERPTLSSLHDKLFEWDNVHVVHFICHGVYDQSRAEGVLLLENEQDGSIRHVRGTDLGPLLNDERSLRLVVLNSCEGARTSHLDPFAGVATSLVQYSIPAVVAMQFEITNSAAITFSRQLYTSLAAGYPIDAALVQARRRIWASQADTEFGTPVLFLHASDARLFTFKKTTIRLRPVKKADPEAAASSAPTATSSDTESARAASPPGQLDEDEVASDRLDDGVSDRPTGVDGSRGGSKTQPKWSATVIQRDKKLAAFRLDLSESHELRYEWGLLKDTLKLNGETIRVFWTNLPVDEPFTLRDGETMRTARVTAERHGFDLGKFSLKVSGRWLHREE